MSRQAREAGNKADEMIKHLANPSKPIVGEQAVVKVLDKAQPVEPTAPVNPQEHDWEQRFTGYKASADSTIHALRKQVEQFDLVNKENEALKRDLETTQAQIPKTADEMLKLFSQEEVDGLSQMLDSRVGSLADKVERLTAELDQVHTAEAKANANNVHQSVVDAVKVAVPDYEQVDNDPAFRKWLDEPDSFGNVRYDMLIRAKRTNPPDVGRIVQFYLDYSQTESKVQEEPQQQYTQQELLQTPRSSPSARTEVQQSLGIKWDLPTINQFYKDKAIGKIPPDKAKMLEADLYQSRQRRQ